MNSTKTLAQFLLAHGQSVQRANRVDYVVGRHPKQFILQHVDPWTFPKLSKHPQRNQFSDPLLWVAMLHEERILGFALWNQPTTDTAALISFKINAQFRNQGVGHALLAFCESVARQWNVQELLLNYRTYWKSNAYWEKILQKQQWQYLSPNLYYVQVNDADLLYEKMGQQVSKIPIFQSINEQNWAQLKSTVAQPEWQQAIPNGLHPMQLANRQIDLQISGLLLDETQTHIIGWCIAHQLSATTWQVTSLFIKKAYRTSKIGLATIREAAKRHQNRGSVHFVVQAENTKMLAYVKRYMVHWGCDLFSQQVAYKKLSVT
ncbi:MAG: GNAT family N-acetyltransferase [Bacteroidota bacterium]